MSAHEEELFLRVVPTVGTGAVTEALRTAPSQFEVMLKEAMARSAGAASPGQSRHTFGGHTASFRCIRLHRAGPEKLNNHFAVLRT
jgi:hypothetical protein